MPGVDLDIYRKRKVAERGVGRFKQWHGASPLGQEAGGQLLGDGGHGSAYDLAILVNHQTRPK